MDLHNLFHIIKQLQLEVGELSKELNNLHSEQFNEHRVILNIIRYKEAKIAYFKIYLKKARSLSYHVV